MSYFDARDTERESPLTRYAAAHLQLGGTAVVDEDGQIVILPAHAIVTGRDPEPEAEEATAEEAAPGSETALSGVSIPEIQANIEVLSDEDIETLKGDARKGAREAAEKEAERRAAAAEETPEETGEGTEEGAGAPEDESELRDA